MLTHLTTLGIVLMDLDSHFDPAETSVCRIHWNNSFDSEQTILVERCPPLGRTRALLPHEILSYYYVIK